MCKCSYKILGNVFDGDIFKSTAGIMSVNVLKIDSIIKKFKVIVSLVL